MMQETWKSGFTGVSPQQQRDADLEAERAMPAIHLTADERRQGRDLDPMTDADEAENVFERELVPEGLDAETMSRMQNTSERNVSFEARMRAGQTQGGTGVWGLTLADAEKAAMERGHTVLVETQLQRISELEEQLNAIQAQARENSEAYDAKEPPRAVRHRLPAERASVTHRFVIAGHEGHITVGLYPNGSPGEIFLRMTKEGSAIAGLLDCFSSAVSLALQHGVPVRVLAAQYAEMRFEPSGMTANEQIPHALSIMDYLFRWIELRFLSGHQMDLFAPLSAFTPQSGAVRVTGRVSGPKSSVVPHLTAVRSADDN